MIVEIINDNILPVPQEGEATIFKRRKPEDGNIQYLESIDQIFDYSRMLDAQGHLPAFFKFVIFKLEFSQARLQSDKTI